MSSVLYLEDKITGPLRPREGEFGNMSSISPFAIPYSILVDSSVNQNLIILFEYAGGQIADQSDPLDDRVDPMVYVRLASRTNTVMGLFITPSVGKKGIQRVAERLLEKANHLDRLDRKFSYQMVGRVLQAYAPMINPAFDQ